VLIHNTEGKEKKEIRKNCLKKIKLIKQKQPEYNEKANKKKQEKTNTNTTSNRKTSQPSNDE
jgi:hypothetical protein